jgi:hypothetical protein
MKPWSFRKILRTAWITFGVGFLLWNTLTFQSWNLPDDTFVNADGVTVEQSSDKISFWAPEGTGRPEIIFLQGGMTDPKAYAPLCRELAKAGFTSHVVKSNWRVPRWDKDKAMKLFDVKNGNYIIAGHSQGATIAAQLVYENPGMFKGLMLMGTSHPRDIDLSQQNIPCIKLYAQHDGLASVGEVMQNKDKLPAGCSMVMIEGGNHSQFGYLGRLLMDDDATISREDQQRETVGYLVAFLKNAFPADHADFR